MTDLDLSALDMPLSLNNTNTENLAGTPKEIPIEDIYLNPKNPRKSMDQRSLEELAQTIKKHRVRSPISVQPHPTLENKWLLNFGERRLKASKIAGKKTIPSVISEPLSDYELVIENIQREDFEPLDLAEFIQDKLSEGIKPSEIATNLGKSKSFINEIISLIDPPACIKKLYTDGKTVSPRTIYDLRKLFDKKPSEVESWCKTTQDVTRGAVNALKNKLENSDASQEPSNKQEKKPSQIAKDPNTISLENNISEKVGIPTTLKHRENGKGSLTFKYSSLDELEGLLDHLDIER